MSEQIRHLLTINPGSTSTKLSLFENDREVRKEELFVDADKIKDCLLMIDQLELRLQSVRDFIRRSGIDMTKLDMIVARGGSINGVKSGAYLIDEHIDTVLRYAPRSQHVSSLAGIIAYQLSKEEASQLAQRQYKFIQNLEAALVRIENKTYGICRETGKLIPKERLRLVPHATLTVEAKEMLAKKGQN